MFVMVFPDGRFLKNLGSSLPTNQSHIDYWQRGGASELADYALKGNETHKTTNINEAKIFTSIASCRSTNAYSLGARPKEVETIIKLKEGK